MLTAVIAKVRLTVRPRSQRSDHPRELLGVLDVRLTAVHKGDQLAVAVGLRVEPGLQTVQYGGPVRVRAEQLVQDRSRFRRVGGDAALAGPSGQLHQPLE